MPLRPRVLLAILALVVIPAARGTSAQQPALQRLPANVFDVVPPSARVRGAPGTLTLQPRPCRTLQTGETRRRVVDIAVQEWAFFGFRVAAPADDDDSGDDRSREERRRRSRLPPDEAARVASTIAGYWAVTPEGSWIVARQNDRWNGPDGISARWNAPWSAAFVSWVMCEAGLGATTQFTRAIAHHAYIDQAIRARGADASPAAFAAYDVGETAITPGDVLCSSRRPAYRSIADRRRQLGVGARSHCDVVVKVDEAGGRVFAIGGNVRGVVSLKQLPATREPGRPLRPHTGDPERPLFAHLKLRAAAIDGNALDTSLAIKASGCVLAFAATPGRPAAAAATC